MIRFAVGETGDKETKVLIICRVAEQNKNFKYSHL